MFDDDDRALGRFIGKMVIGLVSIFAIGILLNWAGSHITFTLTWTP